MKIHAYITNPEEVILEIDVTMSVAQWREVMRGMDNRYACLMLSQQIAACIGELVSRLDLKRESEV